MWNQALVRELAIVLALKFIALFAIWLAFFNHPDVKNLSHDDVGQHLLGETRKGFIPQSTASRGEPDDL